MASRANDGALIDGADTTSASRTMASWPDGHDGCRLKHSAGDLVELVDAAAAHLDGDDPRAEALEPGVGAREDVAGGLGGAELVAQLLVAVGVVLGQRDRLVGGVVGRIGEIEALEAGDQDVVGRVVGRRAVGGSWCRGSWCVGAAVVVVVSSVWKTGDADSPGARP